MPSLLTMRYEARGCIWTRKIGIPSAKKPPQNHPIFCPSRTIQAPIAVKALHSNRSQTIFVFFV